MGVVPQVPVTVYVSALFLSVLQIGSFLWIHLQVQGTFSVISILLLRLPSALFLSDILFFTFL